MAQPRSLDELIAQRFGFRTTPVVNPLVSSVGTSVVAIAPNNPRRVALIVMNLSATANLFVLPERTVSTTKAIVIGPMTGQSFIWDEDFHILAWEWFGVASAADTPIMVLSIEMEVV